MKGNNVLLCADVYDNLFVVVRMFQEFRDYFLIALQVVQLLQGFVVKNVGNVILAALDLPGPRA